MEIEFHDREKGNGRDNEDTKLDKSLKFCVRKNIFFVEPVERIVKPQSRLDLLAIRKVLEKLNF